MTKTNETVLYIIISILIINLFLMIWENLSHLEVVLISGCFIIGILIFNELFILRQKNKLTIFLILTIIVYLFITYTSLYFQGNSIRNFYFIILYQVYRYFSKKVSFSIFFFIITTHLIIKIYDVDSPKETINILSQELSLFILIFVIIMLITNVVSQNTKLEDLRNELTMKNLEIEHTHHQLLSAYNKLEEMTIIKERNQISRNMHDTVGHTLTTALIELEVSKMKLKEDVRDSEEKLTGAIRQVRKGLQDLRSSVKTLKKDIDYSKEIIELINNTIEHTGVNVHYYIDKKIDTVNQQTLSCVYRILQEGFTNGIKHGKANSFIINVDVKEHQLIVRLENNGEGLTVFKKGFGIQAMEERVKELNGEIMFEYGTTSGFGIQVIIPVGGETDDENRNR